MRKLLGWTHPLAHCILK